jgi:hypothetical protein
MNSMDRTLTELLWMLKIAEESIKKSSNHVMMVQKDKKRKRWSPKAKAKGKVPKESSMPKPDAKATAGPYPNDKCFHCNAKGPWSRNYSTWNKRKRREIRDLL